MKNTIVINIAGERIDVLFDGKMVSPLDFPDQPMEFTARCGARITQEMLVEICKHKLSGGQL